MKHANRRGRQSIKNLRHWLLVAPVLFPNAMAWGQEALRSPIANTTSTEPPPPPVQLGPSGLRLGPVMGQLNLYGSVTYNDNINATEGNRKSDEIITTGLNTSFSTPVSLQSQISLNIGIGYATYLQNSQDSTLAISPNSVLNWDIGIPDGYVSLFDALSYTKQVYNNGALAGINQLPVWNNSTGVSVSWTPGNWITQAGYSYDKQFSGSSGDSYLDLSTHDIFTRLGWSIAEKTQAGIEASGSYSTYASSSLGDTISYSVGGYANWTITPFISLQLRGGPTVYYLGASSTSASSQLDSYYFDVSLFHQLTEHISQSLVIQRSVQVGLNQGSQYIEDLNGIYAISWALASRVNVSVNADYEEGSQPLQVDVPVFPDGTALVNALENFRRYGGGAQITYQFSDHVSTGLNYNYWYRNSNLPDRNYVDNSVTLNLNYGF